MKKPIEPIKPYGSKPSNYHLDEYKIIQESLFFPETTLPLDDFIARLEQENADALKNAEPCSENPDCSIYVSIYPDVNGYQISFFTNKKVKKTKYELKLGKEYYDNEVKLYAKYLEDMKVYNEKLKIYQQEMQEWSKQEKEKQIQRLKKELAKLEKNT